MIDRQEIEARLTAIEKRDVDIYHRIGMLCTLFSGLETELRELVALLEDSQDVPVDERLPATEQYSRTVKRLRCLTRTAFCRESQAAVSPIITRLKQVGQKRNDIVHSSWNAMSNDLYHQVRVRPRKSVPQSQDDPTAPGFITNVAEECADLIWDLDCLREEQLT